MSVGYAADPVDELLSRLQGVKRSSPTRWMALCPAHDDDKPSLRVTRGRDGRALVKCFAGCTYDAVALAAGLTVADLFADDPEPPKPMAKANEPDVIYTYHDSEGELLYQVVRKPGKNFVQRRPDGAGKWAWNLEGVERVPYRLPELLRGNPERTVLITEGEKDVDRLYVAGVIATTNSGGAGNWTASHSRYLEGRNVVILPDNDAPGRAHAAAVALSLYGVADSIRIVYLPGLPPKGDVSDWLDAGHALRELPALVDAVPEWEPGSPTPAEAPPTPDESDISRTAAQAAGVPDRWVPVPISELAVPDDAGEWLWEGYIRQRFCTLFSGVWKSGKSTALSYLLRSMGCGDTEFAGKAVVPCKVLYVSEEDALLWIERRDRLGLRDSVSMVCYPFLGRPSRREWDRLIAYVRERAAVDEYGLVIFDSLPNLWAVSDENDNAQLAQAFSPLRSITEQGAAVLAVMHPPKGEDVAVGQMTRGGGQSMSFADILIEMRLFSPKDATDTKRILSVKGRFGVHEQVVEFEEGFGYSSVGTRQEVHRHERRVLIFQALPTEPPGYTVEEVLANWPADTTPGKGQLASDLTFLAREGVSAQRTGKGTRTDPYRYYHAEGNARWAAPGAAALSVIG